MAKSYQLSELANFLKAELRGDPSQVISGLAPLQSATDGHLSFLNNPTYQKFLTQTKASAVIVSLDIAQNCPQSVLIVDDPYYAYAQVAKLFSDIPEATPGIHPSAVVDSSAVIHPSVSIEPHVVIGKNVVIGVNTVVGAGSIIGEGVHIGENCRIWPRVSLYYRAQIGNHVTIHSGAVIGSDGFGYAKYEDKWHPIAQLGSVIIGNHVSIGANTTIDRGALQDTIIEEGVQLDNQIQIAHNVKVGAHTIIAGCVGVAGSTTIGRHCFIGGACAIAGHLTIADRVTLTGCSTLSASLTKPGVYSSGIPVQDNRNWRKMVAYFFNLDKLSARLRAVEKNLNNLKGS